MRLILHTGAYWLLLDVREAKPKWLPLRHTEFANVRPRLLKIAGRIIETASRIRIAFASCCPKAEAFGLVALVRTVKQRGADAPVSPDPPTPNASTASSIQSFRRRLLALGINPARLAEKTLR
jgi:hypothetical protein